MTWYDNYPCVCAFIYLINARFQYAALAEYSGLYTATPVPNPDLAALGVKFGTVEEFLETEVKPRFA